MASITVQRKLLELKDALPDDNPIKYVQRIDNVLFSHGGVCDFFVRECVKSSLYNNADAVVDEINHLRKYEMWNDAKYYFLRCILNIQRRYTNRNGRVLIIGYNNLGIPGGGKIVWRQELFIWQ